MAIFKDGSTSSSDRSTGDRKRHRQLLENAIKRNLGDIIAEENIIGQSSSKKFKIPIKGVKEYQFIYGRSDGAASGTGKETKGQTVGNAGDGGQQQPGQGPAGSQPGEEVYETEVTMDEIINYLFDELKLPAMDRTKYGLVETEQQFKYAGYQRKGIQPRLAKKRTVIEKLKRKQALKRASDNESSENDEDVRIPFREDDLRYRRVRITGRPCANAVVICIMDVSGSMDQTKKYLARSFYFLLYQFVRWRYEKVEVVFIAHTTEAKEVDEWEFFHHGEAGGTAISSGYAKALAVIEERYNPDAWNIYAFHCSDGDNWTDDNPKAVELAERLCQVCSLFGYGEINLNQSFTATIRREFENLKARNFAIAVMNKKDDIWPAFKKLLDSHGPNEGAYS